MTYMFRHVQLFWEADRGVMVNRINDPILFRHRRHAREFSLYFFVLAFHYKTQSKPEIDHLNEGVSNLKPTV